LNGPQVAQMVANELSEPIFRAGKRNDRGYLRKVGIGGGSRQQPQWMSAVVWVPVSEPRSLAAARTEPARRKCVTERGRPPSVAYDGCIARVGRGADLFEPHDLLALDGLVDSPAPV